MKTEFTEQQLRDPGVAVSAQAIRKCVHCGFCLATCPTYLLLGDERDSPRGRIYLMKQMLEKEQEPTADVVRHIDRCLSCLACTTTCPSGVDYMHLVDHSRAYIEKHYRRPMSERILRFALARVLPYRARFRFALRAGRLAAPLSGLARKYRPLESVATLLDLARSNPPAKSAPADSPARAVRRGRVLMMQGCAESVVRPQIRAAAIRVLNRIGYDVVFAREEQCCGALVHHMGRDVESVAFARRTVEAWSRISDRYATDGGVDAIIITTSGCGTLIKDYGFLLRDEPRYAERAARVSALAKDISEILAPEDLQVEASDRRVRVAYHGACSLQHGQKLVAAPKRLLEAAGFEVCTPADSHLCCGSAGAYSILQPQISARLGERKAANLVALGADVIATGNVGCAMQIAARTSTPVVHVVELLDWASGGPPPVPALAHTKK